MVTENSGRTTRKRNLQKECYTTGDSTVSLPLGPFSGFRAKDLSLSSALPALSLSKGATRCARVTSPSSPAGKRQRVLRLLFLQWGRNDPVGGSGIPPETPYRIGNSSAPRMRCQSRFWRFAPNQSRGYKFLMLYKPDQHHRRSLRLKGYNYSSPGFYLVTICTQDRACLFGQVSDDVMTLNGIGRMIEKVWTEIPEHYPNIGIDGMIIMPNHVHGIIAILPVGGVGPCAYPNETSPPGKNNDQCIKNGHPRGDAPPIKPLSLSDVVHRFKSFTTAKYRHGVYENKWSPFNKRLWQRNYHDQIIRNQRDLHQIRDYIKQNPKRWNSTMNCNPQMKKTTFR